MSEPVELVRGRRTDLGFLVMILLFGGNYVEIPVSVQTLGLFWGAFLRLGTASLVLLVLKLLLGRPFPRGCMLAYTLVYGVLAYGATLSLLYWGEISVSPDTATIAFATIPIWIMLFSWVVRADHLNRAKTIGAVVAFLGIIVAFGDALGLNTPVVSLMAVLGAAVCYSSGQVAIAKAGRVDLYATNSLAFGFAALMVLVLAFSQGESAVLPTMDGSAFALTWLTSVSVIAYAINLRLIQVRGVSYVAFANVLIPLVTAGGSVLAGLRAPTAGFYGGVIVVFVGLLISGIIEIPLRFESLAKAKARRTSSTQYTIRDIRPNRSDSIPENGSADYAVECP